MTVECPLCGGPVGLRLVPDFPERNWVMPHLDAVRFPVAVACAASGLNPDEAAGVARIIETEGDRLRLAAHP